jgi:ABC-2 type transport system permease protein
MNQLLQDISLIFRRQLRQSLRNPVWVVIGLINPILYLAFFGPLATQFAKYSNPNANGWSVYVPGLLVQLGLFGSSFVGFGLIGEWREGIIERMRVTPVSRVALLLGRVLRDVVVLLTQSLLLLAAAVILGLRAPLFGVLLGLFFIVMLAVSLSSVSYTLAMMTKSEDSFAAMTNTITVPLMLLSGILLPMNRAPAWLRTIAHFNPFYYIVEAIRDTFQGHYFSSSVGAGMAVALVMSALAIWRGTTTFQKENV